MSDKGVHKFEKPEPRPNTSSDLVELATAILAFNKGKLHRDYLVKMAETVLEKLK